MGPRLRVAAAVALFAAVALAVALAGGIRESKRDAVEAERRGDEERRVSLTRRLEAESGHALDGPHRWRLPAPSPASGSPAAPGSSTGCRSRSSRMPAVARARAPSRGRSGGSSASPSANRRGRGAEGDLSRRRGRYSCLAVTAEIEGSETVTGVVTGHHYRAVVDFESGRYAFCTISGQAGPTRDPLVTTPRACGG